MNASLWPGVIDEEGALVPSSTFDRARQGTAVQAHTAYQHRPVEWIVEKLGIARESIVWSANPGYQRRSWDGTPDPLVAILDGIAAGDDVGVEAATGTQKSHTAACLIFWFLACWKGARVFTYAPKEDQLRLFIWAEIAELWPRFQRMFPTAELTDLRIRMDGTDKWSAHGVAVGVRAEEKEGSATKAQGGHAPHMLIVTEETPGIESSVMAALRNTRTGSHNPMLALGNPDNQQDTLHRFCSMEDVRAVRISAYDHPNVVTRRDVVPGAASPKGIRRIAAEFEPGTPMYESRVRGISPAESTDALIKLVWCQAAAVRQRRLLAIGGQRAMGVDVANSEKGDKASRSYWLGAALEKIKSGPCPDANRLGTEVVTEAELLGIDPQHVGVDPVGVGAGTVNEAERLKFPVRRLGGNDAPVQQASRAEDGSLNDWVPDANRFNNLRSQMGWQLREDLRNGRIGLPNDPKLFRQLTSVRFKVEGGKVVMEEKKVIKKRLGRSPDDFDSTMYGNWVRPRAAQPGASDVGDDRHPGFDYKRKRVRPRTQPIGPDGAPVYEDDDLRPNRYAVPAMAGGGGAPFRTPRWGQGSDEGDDDN
jgi:hypothetical protein